MAMGQLSPWAIEEDETGDTHVFPVGDLLSHDADNCPCLPFIQIQQDFVYLVIHNAWDNRSRTETD